MARGAGVHAAEIPRRQAGGREGVPAGGRADLARWATGRGRRRTCAPGSARARRPAGCRRTASRNRAGSARSACRRSRRTPPARPARRSARVDRPSTCFERRRSTALAERPRSTRTRAWGIYAAQRPPRRSAAHLPWAAASDWSGEQRQHRRRVGTRRSAARCLMAASCIAHFGHFLLERLIAGSGCLPDPALRRALEALPILRACAPRPGEWFARSSTSAESAGALGLARGRFVRSKRPTRDRRCIVPRPSLVEMERCIRRPRPMLTRRDRPRTLLTTPQPRGLATPLRLSRTRCRRPRKASTNEAALEAVLAASASRSSIRRRCASRRRRRSSSPRGRVVAGTVASAFHAAAVLPEPLGPPRSSLSPSPHRATPASRCCDQVARASARAAIARPATDLGLDIAAGSGACSGCDECRKRAERASRLGVAARFEPSARQQTPAVSPGAQSAGRCAHMRAPCCEPPCASPRLDRSLLTRRRRRRPGPGRVRALRRSVKAEARRAGIREATLQAAFAGVAAEPAGDRAGPAPARVHPDLAGIPGPRAAGQPGCRRRARTTPASAALLAAGRARAIGVDPRVIVGIWGIESALRRQQGQLPAGRGAGDAGLGGPPGRVLPQGADERAAHPRRGRRARRRA